MKLPKWPGLGNDSVPQLRSNDRLIDSVRSMFGLNRAENLTERIVPVIVADPDAPPPMQYKGVVGVSSAANAGFRSEVALFNGGPTESLLKCWIDIIGTTAALLRMNAVLAGYTQVNTPYTDSRLVTAGGTSGTVFAVRKNTAAANTTGVQIGDFYLTGAQLPRLGPFWLAGSKAILAQSSADNVGLTVIFTWEWFGQVR